MELILQKEIKKALKCKKYIILTLMFGILQQVAATLTALLINKVISSIENGSFLLTNYLWKIIVIIIASSVITFFYCYVARLLFTKAVRDFDIWALNRLFKRDSKLFEDYANGEIINYVKNVGANIARYYVDFWINIIINLAAFSLAFGVLLSYNYIISLSVLAFIILLCFVIQRISVLKSKIISLLNMYDGEVMNNFTELLSNFQLIKMTDKEKYFCNQYEKNYDNTFYKTMCKYKLYDSFYTAVYSFLVYILPLAVLLFGVALKNYLMISVGAVVAMYSLVGSLQEPIQQSAVIISNYKENKERLKSIAPLLSLEKNDSLHEFTNFEHLTFSSKGLEFGNNNILTDIQFEINQGDFCALKGPSGCGKSTVLKLIMKEFKSDEVKIILNGLDINDVKANSIVLCATQSAYLFHTSIKDNICLGDSFLQEDLEEVSKICVLDDFIEKYTFDKVIDNLDSNISGGEKQRVCLARILIRKPKLLLLDEVTASLDKTTAEKIAKNISDYAKKYNITVVCISHKDEFEPYITKSILI